uniref:helix-turn-helix domain-containing protein n=1 Tax=Fusobacterium necrophorum TaxID=859 RepID=UPI000AE4D716|nr:helix-turn-helix domain-containing protein [Fusobacterium necrophorum]
MFTTTNQRRKLLWFKNNISQKDKHLTLWERGQIEAYWNMGLFKTEIALRIGVSRRIIQREIQRE